MIAFRHVDILPNYFRGFTFSWRMAGEFADPFPWAFRVEEGPTPEGPWSPLSPPLVNRFAWDEQAPRFLQKDPVQWFRIVLTTSKGRYESDVRQPCSDLTRREYLLVRDIMRREVLQDKTLSGTRGEFWMISVESSPCTVCRDPVTNDVINSECNICFGTGRVPPYYGPFQVWLRFSPVKRTTKRAQDGTGNRQPRVHQARMIGALPVKDGDLLVDLGTGKRFIADDVSVVTEIRRVPVVQEIMAAEAPVTDPVYKVGVPNA